MTGSEFTDKVVDDDIANAAAISADIFVMAAFDELPATEVKRAFARAGKAGIEPLFLDRSALVAPSPDTAPD